MDEEFIFRSLSYLKTVPGRMQVVNGHPQNALIVIDYAHTPDALENAILSIKKITLVERSIHFLVAVAKET